MNATTLPTSRPQSGAVVRRRHDDAGERDRTEEVAEREHRGEVLRGAQPGAVRTVDAVAQPDPRALLQPVGTNDRGAADRLGELGDHVADARAFLVVRRSWRRWKKRNSGSTGTYATSTSSVSCHE